ncbi:sensor histidine kinase [Streptomyces orinoci]|uniref:histidine kinase n=1 Tax=Streptomyces orinoci TaxID=67339 RepID=A0ABV3JT71_STRON|nr:nitrate- and nitrite sensing domain-containing protein [Streptomyces orinoci]
MRKKRLRGGQREQQTTAVPERTARVRNRLIVAVLITSLTVLGAGALGLADALREAGDSQRAVPLGRTAADAVQLAHALADERDAMTEYVAAGRGPVPAALTAQRAQVDRTIRRFAAAPEVRHALPSAVRGRLDKLAEVRRRTLAGPGEPLAAFTAYTATVQALHGVAGTLAVRLPPGSGAADASAVALLGRAVEEDSATRGLYLAALAGRGTRPELQAAAQQTAFREQAALADFTQLAPAKARDAYAATVTGPQATAAEARLARITEGRQSADTERAVDPDTVRGTLTARLALMRQVESALAGAEAAHLDRVHGRDVTALQARCALIGCCLLLALLAGIQSARSVTRPLAALRLGARRVCADPLAREPVSVKGRDDEFAEVARSVNVLHGTVVRQRERIGLLEGERARLDAARQDLADERDALRVRDRELTERLAGLTVRAHATCAGLSQRTLLLVERQLSVIEALEAHEADPDRLEVLFKLDHLATRMRRNSENLLVLSGAEAGAGHAGPVPLLDVLRAAVSEIDRYERVRIHSLPARAQLAGSAADDVSHLVAELLENATEFSPADVQVQVSGWLLENGDVMLSVQDEGIGMAPDRLDQLNSLLAQPDPEPRVPMPGADRGPDDAVMGLGLYVVARLAGRHGVRVQLREQRPGGITAVVVLPARLLPRDTPPAAPPRTTRRTSSIGPLPAPPDLPPDDATLELALPPADRPPTGRHARPVPRLAQPGGVPPAEAGARLAPGTGDAGPGGPGAVPGPVGVPDVAGAGPRPGAGLGAAPGQGQGPGAEWARPAAGETYVPGATPRSAAAAHGMPGATGGVAGTGTVPGTARTRETWAAASGAPGTMAATDDMPGPAGVPGMARARDTAASAAPGSATRSAVTGNGLPKRTPKPLAQKPPQHRVRRAVDAEALRRKLAGFQQGARDGRRDAAAELAGREHNGRAGEPEQGGNVEEARG